MEIKVKHVDSTLDKLAKDIEKEHKRTLLASSKDIMHDLVLVTPVDTGLAQDSWRLNVKKKSVVISNNVPYINELNRGHSQQAPPYFIEKVLLRHGKASGTLVIEK